MKWIVQGVRASGLCVFAGLFAAAGCVAPGVSGEYVPGRVSPYAPDVETASLDLPFEDEAPADPVGSVLDEGEDIQSYVSTRSRPLRHGDRLVISLHVLESTTLQEQVDESGNISLPYIGSVRVVGMTTGEAERTIRRIYVDERKIYKTLEVSVRAEAEEFFVSGQVQRPGKYASLTGEKTLLQGIAEAGGFTPFANQKKIRVIRSGTGVSEFYNAENIRRAEDPDPLINPGDQIIVPRKFM